MIEQLSPQALAYVGDAVQDLYVRTRLVTRFPRSHDLHRAVVAHVRASTQSQILEALEPSLSEDERHWLRRGRNQKGASAQRRRSTALESLLGWLHLSGQNERLHQLLDQIFTLSDTPLAR